MRTLTAALSATVLSLGLLTACTTPDAPESGTQSPAPATQSATEPPAQSETATPEAAPTTGDPKTTDLVDQPPTHTWQEALSQAQETFGGSPVEVELEWDHGILRYEIDLVTDTEKIEVKLDAQTLDQLSEERSTDPQDIERAKAKVFDPATIDIAAAAQQARTAATGVIVEWTIEGTRGGAPEIEFTFLDAPTDSDIEVTVNAQTNQIIEVD